MEESAIVLGYFVERRPDIQERLGLEVLTFL